LTSSVDPSGVEPRAVADTSIAIPLALSAHPHHRECVAARHEHRPALAGHSWFETYSVLTRLSDQHRISPRVAADLIAHNFPTISWLSAREQAAAARRIQARGVHGGPVYDALVAAAAMAAGLPLLSCDRRAVRTYEAMGAEVILVG
jgi:predicted nucleic acid-binding protein